MIKKIPSEHLEVGMFVADFNTPWLDHPFLGTSKALRNLRDIRVVVDHGIAEVYIDTDRGKDSPRACPVEEADQALRRRLRDDLGRLPADGEEGARPRGEEIPFEEEVRKAREVHREGLEAVRGVFGEVCAGRAPDAERARASVTRMIESIFRNRDALVCLSRLKSVDEYTFHHCLNVCVLAIHLGIHLGILQDELVRLGTGALLHDLGKARLPGELLRKRGPLTPAEFELVKTHAAHGADLLLRAETVPDECALVALNHHERYDGTGYPRGLSGASVGKFGLITGIVDLYDAMTSERVYRPSVPPCHALKRAYEWSGTQFHPIYVRKFIQCMGVYPVGSCVRLDTGEVGVVLRQNRGQLLRPWVRVVCSREGRPLRTPVDRDLREPASRGEGAYARGIERVLEGLGVGFDPDRILGLPSNLGPARGAGLALD